MIYFNIKHHEIKKAINDLKSLIIKYKNHIDRVMLFGSTLTIPIDDAKDIDFFISYKGLNFEDLRKSLLKVPLRRRIVVENIEADYRNHPEWPKEIPLTLHIILYREGILKFSEKLKKTKEKAIDISSEVLDY